MNKNQRVLTLIALIAFVVIGVCHYLASPPLVSQTTRSTVWKELTYEQAQRQAPSRFLDLIFVGNLEKQGGYTDSKGQWHAYTKDDVQQRFNIPDEAKLWFPVETETTRSIWKPHTYPGDSMVPDVRIPWLMVGLIYAGLFLLLGR